MARTSLFVTTSQKPSEALRLRAGALAAELDAPVEARGRDALEKLFARRPEAARALVVEAERLVLVARDGWSFFHHPNLAAIRLKNLLDGKRDLLLEAAELAPGDSVLDATLGYGGEATLCAWAVGEAGEVHGIEAVAEVGVVVREGLKGARTESERLNEAMRRVQVVHLGRHEEFLARCEPRRYDVVCFDPFFDASLSRTETIGSLRAFGDHGILTKETLELARRAARRRVIVKTSRYSALLEELGIQEWVTSRQSKLVYGVLPAA